MIHTDHLQTERRNPRTIDLDTLPTDELAARLHAENFEPADAVERVLSEIARAIDVIAHQLDKGGRLFYVGAGTSGRLGVLDASECPPTFGVEPGLIRGLIAGGDYALRNSIEGAEDNPASGARDLVECKPTERDVVVGIAASGRTPYVIGALSAAREVAARTIAVVNVSPSEMQDFAEITIAAVTGPEPLTGSTRMKAGTAQKMVLNLISTGAMIRLGKTYENLMVDVRATNEKLRDRAARIVMDATGTDRDSAVKSLEDADWHAKTAIVMVSAGCDANSARVRLHHAGGFVRKALEHDG